MTIANDLQLKGTESSPLTSTDTFIKLGDSSHYTYKGGNLKTGSLSVENAIAKNSIISVTQGTRDPNTGNTYASSFIGEDITLRNTQTNGTSSNESASTLIRVTGYTNSTSGNKNATFNAGDINLINGGAYRAIFMKYADVDVDNITFEGGSYNFGLDTYDGTSHVNFDSGSITAIGTNFETAFIRFYNDDSVKINGSISYDGTVLESSLGGDNHFINFTNTDNISIIGDVHVKQLSWKDNVFYVSKAEQASVGNIIIENITQNQTSSSSGIQVRETIDKFTAQALQVSNMDYKNANNNQYGIYFYQNNAVDIESIDVSNLTFSSNKKPAAITDGNGGVKIDSTPFENTLSHINVSNIVEKGNVENNQNYYGLYLTGSKTLVATNLVSINTIQTNSASGNPTLFGGTFGLYIKQATLEVEKSEDQEDSGLVLIQNISAKQGDAYGLKNQENLTSDTINTYNVTALNGQAYGVYTSGELFVTENNLINGVHGNSVAIGFNVSSDDIVASVISANDIDTTNGDATGIKFNNSSVTPGNKESLTLSATEIDANNGDANGIYFGSHKSDIKSIDDLTVRHVYATGGAAYGLQFSATKDKNVDADRLEITDIHSDQLAIALNIDGSTHLTAQTAVINPGNWTEYQGKFAGEATSESVEVNTLAIRAIKEGTVNLTSESGTKTIYGTILAASGSTNEKDPGGHIKIGGQGVQIFGDVYAGNNGTVEITLNKGSMLEGQIDDYHELNSVAQGTVFKNTSFTTGEVAHAGEATLTLNGGQWIARGQSFVNTLVFGTEGGLVDLSKNENSSVSINNLTGSGEFTMRLDNDPTKSDMLYIQNLDADAKYQVNVVLNNTTRSVYELEDVRIATTNGHYQSWGDNFTAVLADQGVNDVTFKVTKEAFSTEDEDNTAINGKGDGSGTYKPGEDAVNEIYGVKEGSTNWVIASTEGTGSDKPSGPSTSLSDAGNALLATARGTYWTSVEIDRLTNRMGDARYANNGEDGLWIRLRQSRLGTDTGEGDFKSDNTVYQVGYDHAFQRDGGRQLVGVAFDYMDTDLDYKGISGEGNTDRYGITAYTTWLADNGFYVDVVGKWGRLDNDFDIINGSGGRVKADYDNNMWAISAEVGRKLSNPKTGMFIEPNAQLQYTMVTDAQYSTNQGTHVDQDRIDSVIGRMGVRIGRAFGEEQNHNIYAKADMFREFMGEQKIHVKDVTTRVKGDTITVQNKGFWFDVGGGFQSQLGRDAYAYADVEYRFGNDLDKSWIVNAGMRYEF